jgi:hypothetical protein
MNVSKMKVVDPFKINNIVDKDNFVDPFKINNIVDKDNFVDYLNTEMDVTDQSKIEGVQRDIVPVDLGGLREMRITDVAPGTTVPSHAHKSPVFRVITSGEAIVNGKTYKTGDWMLIPTGTPYEIKTEIGYSANWICVVCF